MFVLKEFSKGKNLLILKDHRNRKDNGMLWDPSCRDRKERLIGLIVTRLIPHVNVLLSAKLMTVVNTTFNIPFSGIVLFIISSGYQSPRSGCRSYLLLLTAALRPFVILRHHLNKTSLDNLIMSRTIVQLFRLFLRGVAASLKLNSESQTLSELVCVYVIVLFRDLLWSEIVIFLIKGILKDIYRLKCINGNEITWIR